MSQQNYSSHRQVVPTFHFLTLGLLLVLLIAAIIYFNRGSADPDYIWGFLLLTIVAIISVGLHARTFALKAQDRAIRAEEGLRYFILTGKRLDPRLSMRQVIALRFAADEELEALAAKAVNESMSSNDIKKAVQQWRPDHHRA